MIELEVEGMTCGHCAAAVSRAVKDVDAAATCEVDLRAGRVRIESSHAPGEFRTAIEDAGYTSREARASP